MGLRLNGSTSGYSELSAPAVAGNNTLTLPTGNGTNGQYLQTNGSGALSWSTVAASQWTTTGSDIYYTTGKVGVGTASPGWLLSLRQDTASGALFGYPTVQINNGNATGYAALYLNDSTATAGLETRRDTAHLGLCAGNAERARIDSSGNVFIGATSSFDGAKAEITQSGTANGLAVRASSGSFANDVVMIKADRNTTNGTFNAITYYNLGAGAQKFKVLDSGNVQNTNNSYGALSDAKLKENVVDANSQWNDLKALQVRNYNFKEETGQETHRQIGLIAQEVELISPGLVTESPDRDEDGNDLGTVTKSVNYSVLYMKAVKALQEAMERIETLEASNAALETRLAALEVI